ncbi:ferrous iron transport protein B [Vagococcus elongatus]|uniref:Ferrous iron transport protein B n=1 Tax=Vagococcus elongatus TaxID=180344 RepID=A0A430B505_9ENTE|nr:ferrous iron transport protein B [Vagococcus elongatus]RSU15292.1 ferrous iron transport protein B [Vagococcus elongatus]
MTTTLQIALAGNPNSGKTSLFNEITGTNQRVGNWPGVTIEKKSGKLTKYPNVELQDLPGIYSLSPYSPEELVARNYLIDDAPDLILNLIDGTNIERNLYLTTQLLELGVPVIIGINMMDVVEKNKQTIDIKLLSEMLYAPIVGLSVTKKKNIDELMKRSLHTHATSEGQGQNHIRYDKRLEVALEEIADVIEANTPENRRRWFSIKLFERDEEIRNELHLTKEQQIEINEIIAITEKIFQTDSTSIMINERYDFITRLVEKAVTNKSNFELSLSDKIDHVVTHRIWALPIFALVMWMVYYLSIQTVGTMATDWVNDVLFGEVIPKIATSWLAAANVAPWLEGLILEGIIAGVGAVLGFLPQMIVLFLCLALLEDCGYMARIAFVMDRLFRRFGLSGKSFIPMLISTGCGVPGVMACRTIENEKERKMTIMTTTFMPCSAKMPVIALIAGAFFPHSSWVAPAAYFVGIGAIILSGIALKKTKLFAGEASPFIMELPAYHFPHLKNVFFQTYERGKSFVIGAGTIIFTTCVLLWFMASFNFKGQMVATDKSILAALGNSVAFIFAPLGFGTWRAVVATVTGLIAKENVVATFGVLYAHAGEVSENGTEIWGALRASMAPIAGFSFLLFNLLCAPCFAAIGAIKREMADFRWTIFAIAYQCALAYGVSFITYQLGSVLLGEQDFNIGTVLAMTLIVIVTYFFIRKPANKRKPESAAIQIL